MADSEESAWQEGQSLSVGWLLFNDRKLNPHEQKKLKALRERREALGGFGFQRGVREGRD